MRNWAGTIELSNNKLVNKVLGLDYDIKNIQYAKNNKSPKTTMKLLML